MKKTLHANKATFTRLLGAWLALCLCFVPVQAEEVQYYHLDALGSPVAATDETGAVLWMESYEPFGERRERADGGTNSLWYTGKAEDTAIGLNYFGARWYNSRVGRFVAMDPVGVQEDNIHSFNRYVYANNNPYKYVDPDGQASREAQFQQLDMQDPGAGVANRARQIAERASAFGDTLESVATDLTNLIPGGIFAGILKKVGGKLAPKKTALPDSYWINKKAPTQVTPGTRTVNNPAKPSSSGGTYHSTTHYDQFGRQIGQTHRTSHGR